MRVGVVALMHESNTFLGRQTTLADFEADLLAEGREVRERLADAHHEVGGFFERLAEEKIETVPLFAARALPHGPLTAGTADSLTGRLLEAVARAGSLDGILAAPHGAAVAENEPDFDGYWLTRLREALGRSAPLVATLDLHANVSPRMAEACDALIAYRTNPHLDQRDRGREAASLIARALRGKVRPVTATCFPPLAVNIACQATAEPPCLDLAARADAVRVQPGVLSTSLVLGFPYADVPEMGASVLVVADGDRPAAERHAAELARWWWERRADFDASLPGAEEAVRTASRLDGPICLLDCGDNVGGGSPGDGTALAHEFRRQEVGPSFVCLADPGSVRDAAAAGVGGRVELRVGGKTDGRHGEPLVAGFTVRGLFDGRFTEPEPRHGGITTFDQGPTALVETHPGLSIMLTTRRMVPFSLRQLTAFGLEPRRFKALVAKGVHAPVAAYAPVCRHLMRVGTPGVTAVDLSSFDFRRRRLPMFPFEPDTSWEPAPSA